MLRLTLQTAPHLVLLDMMMPVMDGATFVRTLHKSHLRSALGAPAEIEAASNLPQASGSAGTAHLARSTGRDV